MEKCEVVRAKSEACRLHRLISKNLLPYTGADVKRIVDICNTQKGALRYAWQTYLDALQILAWHLYPCQ